MTRVTCKIKDVISEVKSGDWGKGSPTENYTTEVLCVRGADIPELCKGNVGKMPQRFIHNKKATSKILSANNLIIEISGGSPTQSTGRIALISDKILSRYSKPLICSNFCKAITATGIQPEYLFNYWLYLYNKDAMFPYENGTTGIKNLDFNSFIQEQDISIPDIKTQQKIVSILSSIDEKIETNKRINDNLEEQAKALFKSWFVDFEPFKGGKFVDSKLGPIPEGWSIGKVNDVVQILSGFAFKSETFVQSGPYRLITIKGVQDGYLDISGASYISKVPLKMPAYCNLEIGDILLSLTGNVGRVCIVDRPNLLLNQRVAKLQPRRDKQDLLFVYILFRQDTFKNHLLQIARGTAQLNLSPVETREISIILPPANVLLEFSKIGQYLFDKIALSNQETLRLSALRDTLLPKLMSGELSVEEVSFD